MILRKKIKQFWAWVEKSIAYKKYLVYMVGSIPPWVKNYFHFGISTLDQERSAY